MDPLTFAAGVGTALALGAATGAERELRHRPCTWLTPVG